MPIRSEGQRVGWGLGLQGISRLKEDHMQCRGLWWTWETLGGMSQGPLGTVAPHVSKPLP